MNNNMTALVSSFARLYHTKNSNIKIYNDNYSEKIISEYEYELISRNMKNGIKFFNPNYKEDKSLKWIVNNYLAPSVLARSIFNEKHLLNEINLGLKQYVILASGYDTSAFKFNNKLKIFEIDKNEIIEDKLNRINNSNIDTRNITYVETNLNNDWVTDLITTNYNKKEKTFCSMLGISYYLTKNSFKNIIKQLSDIIPKGSAIVFDYPNDSESDKEKINRQLAKGANEEMKSIYTYDDIEKIADNANMLIYEHLNHEDVDNTYFYDYNTLNPNDKIIAPIGVSYCFLVKQ